LRVVLNHKSVLQKIQDEQALKNTSRRYPDLLRIGQTADGEKEKTVSLTP
jgi:hypothetical protein